MRRPCPEDPYPGGNATINYPCASNFQFPVTGDFGVETYMGTGGIDLNMNGRISYNPRRSGSAHEGNLTSLRLVLISGIQ